MNALPVELQNHIWEYDDTKHCLHQKCIRELNVRNYQWSKIKEAVVELIIENNWPENIDYREYSGGWTESHRAFLYKYTLYPYRWIIKSIKTKSLSFWD